MASGETRVDWNEIQKLDERALFLSTKAQNLFKLAEDLSRLAKLDKAEAPKLKKEAAEYRSSARDYLKEAIALRKEFTERTTGEKRDTFRIASWNIQNFGQKKKSKTVVYEGKRTSIPKVVADILLAKKLAVVAIQEVEGDNLEPVEAVVEAMNARNMGQEVYRMTYPEKLGTSANTAEYSPIIFNHHLVKLKTQGMLKRVGMERPPHYAYFQLRPTWFNAPQRGKRLFEFVLVSVHFSPKGRKTDERREKDFAQLPKLFARLQKKFGEKQDIIVAGDFNCDPNCGGIDRKIWQKMVARGICLHPFTTIVDGVEKKATRSMTRGKRMNDNMIWKGASEGDFAGSRRVCDFAREHFTVDGKVMLAEARKISDHLPVWTEFYASRDSDRAATL